MNSFEVTQLPTGEWQVRHEKDVILETRFRQDLEDLLNALALALGY